MNIILLQYPISDQEFQRLSKEFPQYRCLVSQNLSDQEWARVEVLFGNLLSCEQLAKAGRLRWIHAPERSLDGICLADVLARENIIVTTPSEENIVEIGEYVMAAILTFSKQFFRWKEAMRTAENLKQNPLKETIWALHKRIFLQIGLGKMGSEIARRAREFGLRVWGMQSQRSFHAECHWTTGIDDLHTVLPVPDIVCVSLSNGESHRELLGRAELELMKPDSLLIVLGSYHIVNLEALVEVGQKFRGVVFDTTVMPPAESPVWQMPNVLITPEISTSPLSIGRQAFHLFYYNLRQYAHGNFQDMRNRLEK